jgi:ABC-type glycerol-3-phosphate transport system substrate-binding protein
MSIPEQVIASYLRQRARHHPDARRRHPTLIDSREIAPVQDFIDRESFDLSDFEPRLLDYYRVGDRLYSMPFNVSNPVLLYEKNSFREAGLDPEKPPQTLEELTEYSRKLVKRDSQGNVTRSGIALRSVLPCLSRCWPAPAPST